MSTYIRGAEQIWGLLGMCTFAIPKKKTILTSPFLAKLVDRCLVLFPYLAQPTYLPSASKLLKTHETHTYTSQLPATVRI